MTYPVDFQAIRAQVEDGVPWWDGALTYSQAVALIREVERLEKQLREANRTIERLKGMLS